MRRKLKFKEKEKRKEQRDVYKQQQYEHREAMKEVDPLKTHDFSMIKNLREEQAMKVLGFEGSRKGTMTAEPKTSGSFGNVEQKESEF